MSQREPTRATESLDAQILAVPEANPENPYIGARRDTPPAEAGTGSLSGSHDDGASTQSDVSESDQDNEDGREPAKKKRKRVRPEIRKEWGLESVSLVSLIDRNPGLIFSSSLRHDRRKQMSSIRHSRSSRTLATLLDSRSSPLPSSSEKSTNPGMASRFHSLRLAHMHSRLCSFRSPDFATELWLYDPTHKVNPARLCFFGQKEEHLPTVDNGDILILQAVNVCLSR